MKAQMFQLTTDRLRDDLSSLRDDSLFINIHCGPQVGCVAPTARLAQLININDDAPCV